MADPSNIAAPEPQAAQTEQRQGWRRFAPLIAIVAAAGALFVYGEVFEGFYGQKLSELLSLQTLKDNREALLLWRDENFALAAVVFFVAYTAIVAFSIPGALWMTLGGGFLFGVVGGSALTVAAATFGATLIFMIARTSLGEALRERAGPWLQRLEGGVRENEISYMLLLRLVPAVPFFIANLAPAFLGVRPVTYIWTTFVGILPATAVYSWIGAGLGDVLDQGGEPDLGLLFEPHIIGPLLGLAVLAVLPIAIKKLRRSDRPA